MVAVLVLLGHFWRHVAYSSYHGPAAQVGSAYSTAKICKIGLLIVHQDVRRLDVEVQYSLVVNVLDCLAHLVEYLPHASSGQFSAIFIKGSLLSEGSNHYNEVVHFEPS